MGTCETPYARYEPKVGIDKKKIPKLVVHCTNPRVCAGQMAGAQLSLEEAGYSWRNFGKKKTVMQYDRDDRMGLRRWSFSMLILMSSWAASLAPTTKMKWCYQNLDNDPRHFSKHINTTLLQLLNNKKISPECHKH